MKALIPVICQGSDVMVMALSRYLRHPTGCYFDVVGRRWSCRKFYYLLSLDIADLTLTDSVIRKCVMSLIIRVVSSYELPGIITTYDMS